MTLQEKVEAALDNPCDWVVVYIEPTSATDSTAIANIVLVKAIIDSPYGKEFPDDQRLHDYLTLHWGQLEKIVDEL
jgi:hypothetical protein